MFWQGAKPTKAWVKRHKNKAKEISCTSSTGFNKNLAEKKIKIIKQMRN